MIPELSKFSKLETILIPVMFVMGWSFRASSRMITCREFNAFIFDYTEGYLSEKQLVLFERHMRFCPMCRNFLKTYIAGYSAGKVLFPYSNLEVPKTVPQGLLDAIGAIQID
jgi:hypothetical protein